MFGRKLKKQLNEFQIQIANLNLKAENESFKKMNEELSSKFSKKNQRRDSKGRFVKS